MARKKAIRWIMVFMVAATAVFATACEDKEKVPTLDDLTRWEVTVNPSRNLKYAEPGTTVVIADTKKLDPEERVTWNIYYQFEEQSGPPYDNPISFSLHYIEDDETRTDYTNTQYYKLEISTKEMWSESEGEWQSDYLYEKGKYRYSLIIYGEAKGERQYRKLIDYLGYIYIYVE